ncbi:hypothetical protein DFH29DRAFT_1066405 [Suillus ampliporus]|nr:hypothetical protein DFH29DRAFT_1066405 [Suillus ampliporus]
MAQANCESADLAKLCVLIDNLPMLCNSLPSSVPEATDSDLIHRVTTTITGEDPWHTFNHRFDILFGEDCQDDKGHLYHLKRGPLGMGLCHQQLGPEIVQPVAAKGRQKQTRKPVSGNDDEDKDYVPRKPRDVSESPIRPYTVNNDGHEILNESENELPGCMTQNQMRVIPY